MQHDLRVTCDDSGKWPSRWAVSSLACRSLLPHPLCFAGTAGPHCCVGRPVPSGTVGFVRSSARYKDAYSPPTCVVRWCRCSTMRIGIAPRSSGSRAAIEWFGCFPHRNAVLGRARPPRSWPKSRPRARGSDSPRATQLVATRIVRSAVVAVRNAVFGAISRTVCPCAWNTRAQWRAPEQASIPITQDGKDASGRAACLG